MSSLTVSGDLKYLLFIFLGLMISILVLGYHASPKASPSLGATQLAQRATNAFKVAPNLTPSTAPVSAEPYGEKGY